MRRLRITLNDIAERNNLTLAFHRAAKGKRYRADVWAFSSDFENNLTRLADDIRAARLPYNRFRSFTIFDPKQRRIHAACFEDRVFHHALMNLAGPVLERTLLPSSFACRPGKGVHNAVASLQKHLRRYAYYCQIDIQGYFAHIVHNRLLQLLARRFKGAGCLAQWQRIVSGYQTDSGMGLPIGSLTSQFCANYYLDGLDRLLASLPQVRAAIRYMDDIVWWCDDRHECLETLQIVTDWLWQERRLRVKPSVQIQPSRLGIRFCGFRILPGLIRLSRRRKRRFQTRRQYWERLYQQGVIDARQLQQVYAAVQAITVGTDCRSWLRENLRRHPPLTV